MVKHAGHFDGAFVQVTKVFSMDPHFSDTAERKMNHQNHGCTLGTIVSAKYEIEKNCITTTESLAEIDRKKKAQDDGGYPLNKTVSPSPKRTIVI
jgi:hypothetical protein